MQKIIGSTALLILFILPVSVQAQFKSFVKKPQFSGIYLQWGYNRDVFSKSSIRFTNGNKYDFTVHDAVAHDQPNFEAFHKTPLDITIPQNSFRIGVYLNKEHTHAIELNFDHAKYVVDSRQTLRVSGKLPGREIDKDTLIHPWFMSFEHTNGANFWIINYVGQHKLWQGFKRMHASVIWKLGAGFVVPRSDVILFEKRTDNPFHFAGYVLGAESGFRFYPLKNLFLEATVKGGYADYRNVRTVDGGRASHAFRYGEVIGLVGYDINFKKKQKAQAE